MKDFKKIFFMRGKKIVRINLSVRSQQPKALMDIIDWADKHPVEDIMICYKEPDLYGIKALEQVLAERTDTAAHMLAEQALLAYKKYNQQHEGGAECTEFMS